jgi:O-antigen ligase/polysaccharide polymerase Wzy-like membrane protein
MRPPPAQRVTPRRQRPRAALPHEAGAGQTRILYALFLALATTGYPIAGLVTSVVQVEGSTINYGFRFLVVALGAIVAGAAILRGKVRVVPAVVLVFFLFYGIRLYHDTFLDYLFGAEIALAFFGGVVLLPTIAAGLGFDDYDEAHHAWLTFAVAGGASLGVVAFHMLGIAEILGETGNVGRVEFEALNPITIGYSGLFAALAAATLWQRAARTYRPMLLVGGAIGLVALVESASRGPLVSGMACVAFIALARGRFLLFGLLLAVAAYSAVLLSDANLELLSRLRETGTDTSSMERLIYMQNAIYLALAHPLFGHAFIETITYTFPHNLLVESALATGLAGFALMLIIQIGMMFKAYKLARSGYTLLPLLVVCALVNAQLSAFLWAAPEFWIPATLTWMAARRLTTDPARAPAGLFRRRPGHPNPQSSHHQLPPVH